MTQADFRAVSAAFGYNDVAYDVKFMERAQNTPFLTKLYQAFKLSKQRRSGTEGCHSEKIDEQNQSALLYEVEMPLSEILAEMEHTGIAVDDAKLDEIGKTLKVASVHLQKKRSRHRRF